MYEGITWKRAAFVSEGNFRYNGNLNSSFLSILLKAHFGI